MSSPAGSTRIFILDVNNYLHAVTSPAFRMAIKTELSYRNDTILILEISRRNNSFEFGFWLVFGLKTEVDF